MTDRDLSALLERASADVVERDFAQDAWAGAVARRQHRRRVVTTATGALAAAAVAVTTVQLTGSGPRPSPANPTTTAPAPSRLSDGTAYDQMPLEGKETELAHFDAGLPPEIDPRTARTTKPGTGVPERPVAVYVQRDGEAFHPVLVMQGGELHRVAGLSLVPVHDAGGNQGSPLGPRAMGGGGRYAAFAQPGKVVLLDTQTFGTRTFPVPDDTLQSVGWSSDQGSLVARSSDHVWTVDPWKPAAVATAADGDFYEGRYQLRADSSRSQGLTLQRHQDGAAVGVAASPRAPVGSTWGETISTEERAAVGAFFDQDVTSKVIQMGNGPIYQGLVTVDSETNRATVLLAPENPDGQTGRFKGCCSVLGWADGSTVLFQTIGSHGSWVLAWNVTTGRVYEASRILVNPAREDIPMLALTVGWRY